MASIEEIKAEIEKERGLIMLQQEEHYYEKEKKDLQRELNQLRVRRTYGRQVEAAKPIISGVKTAFKKIGSELQGYAEEQARRERQEKSIKKKGFAPQRRGLFG